jgi:hypothetical protein
LPRDHSDGVKCPWTRTFLEQWVKINLSSVNVYLWNFFTVTESWLTYCFWCHDANGVRFLATVYFIQSQKWGKKSDIFIMKRLLEVTHKIFLPYINQKFVTVFQAT